jgi:hypothetical protein
MKFLGALGAAITLGVAAMAGPASADLLNGKTVEVTFLYPTVADPIESHLNMVGTDPDTVFFTDFEVARVEFADTRIAIIAFCDICTWSNAPFNGIRILDFDNQVAAFTGVTINNGTSYAGLDASRLSFTDNQILVNLQDLDGEGVIVLDVTGNVPEPATWAMLIAGLGAAGSMLRRRRRQAALAR